MSGRIIRKSSVAFAKRHERIFTESNEPISIIQLKNLRDHLLKSGGNWSLMANEFKGKRITGLCLVTKCDNEFITFKFTSIETKPLFFYYVLTNIA